RRKRAPRENPLVAVPLLAKGARPKLAARSVAGKKPLRNPAPERVGAPARANGSHRAVNAAAKSFPKTSGGLLTFSAARRLYFRCLIAARDSLGRCLGPTLGHARGSTLGNLPVLRLAASALPH